MTVHLSNLPFEIDAGVSARARLGLITLASDYTIEHEYRQILHELPGVALFCARIMNDPEVTPETLLDMAQRIGPMAATLLPGDVLDVIAYGCTSASMLIGPDKVAALIRAEKPDVAVATPISAAINALRRVGARRVGVLTPYTREVNEGIQSYIEREGFEVPVFGSFDEPMDPIVSRIDPDSVRAGIMRVAAEASVDAVFVSCTSVRLLEQAAGVEAELGLPVISSNMALIWQSLRLAGIDDALPGFGSIFDRGLPGDD